jgi:hypothetical protein
LPHTGEGAKRPFQCVDDEWRSFEVVIALVVVLLLGLSWDPSGEKRPASTSGAELESPDVTRVVEVA